MQHHGTDSTLWEGKDGHPWDIIRNTVIPRETTLDRYQDIHYVTNNLDNILSDYPAIQAMTDTNNIGMSGHSFGALTTQVMGGMLFPNEDNILTSYKLNRFKAGILYSPGSVEHLGDFQPAEVYPPLDIPLMHMTGTDDGSPLSDQGYKDIRLAVYDHTRLADKYMMILNDGDHMVFNGSRGKLGQNPNRDTHESLIKLMALGFWEIYLKDNQSARDWIQNHAQPYLIDQADFYYECL